MRLGGSIPKPYVAAEEWAADAQSLGFRACTCPLPRHSTATEVEHLRRVASDADLLIAEVGVWRNTLALDDSERQDNIAFAQEQLALADELGAPCCVNVAGARGEIWDSWYPDNYSADAYQCIIETTRAILDAVKPRRTFFTLEPMPWMVPDSPEAYLQLIRDVDRPAFAVHMDFVNMLNTPRRVALASEFIGDAFRQLAPYIKSVHLKDVTMDVHAMPAVIRECQPGKGLLDFRTILRVIERTLPADMPVLLEHMDTMPEYAAAFAHVDALRQEENIR